MNMQSTGAPIYKMSDFHRCDDCGAVSHHKDGKFIPIDILENEVCVGQKQEFICQRCEERMMSLGLHDLNTRELADRVVELLRRKKECR